MNNKREQRLHSLLMDWFWMYENELGHGSCEFHGYNGSVVVYKLNCDYMDFCEFQLGTLAAMLRPYGFDVWQSEEYLNVQDVEGITK